MNVNGCQCQPYSLRLPACLRGDVAMGPPVMCVQVGALRTWLLQRAAWMDEQLLGSGGAMPLPAAAADAAGTGLLRYLSLERPPVRTFVEARGGIVLGR